MRNLFLVLVAVVALAIVASPARATDFVVRDRTVVLADGSLATVRDVIPVNRFNYGVNRFSYGNSVLLAAGDARIEFALERRRPRPRPVVVIR